MTIRDIAFKTEVEGFTELLLANGDRIRVKISIGSIQEYVGEKNTDGTQKYNMQHQIVSFVLPKELAS